MNSTDKIGFEKGWDYFVSSSSYSIIKENNIDNIAKINDIYKETDLFINNLNKYKGNSSNSEQLKGFIAEEFHVGTFNIKAKLNGSESYAIRGDSNKFASSDVSIIKSNKETIDYSFKYCKNAQASAKEQAINFIEKYNRYRQESTAKIPLTLEQYLSKNGWDIKDLYVAIYLDQGRVIAADQVEEAKKYLEDRIKRNLYKGRANGAVEIKRIKSTLEKLAAVISDENGIESIPLTKEDATVLAELAKEGNVDLKFIKEKFGLDVVNEVYSIILKDSIKAGCTSGLISMILSIIPDLYKTIDYLIKTGELDINQLKEMGIKGVSNFSTGFLHGSFSCALTYLCKTGKLGEYFNAVDPKVIGPMTGIIINVMMNMYASSTGKLSYQEVGTKFAEELIIMAASYGGGILGQIVLSSLPGLGYLIGSFLGNVISTVTLKIGKKIIMALCVKSGFTGFGLVEQDYTLPDDYLEALGLELIDIPMVDIDYQDIPLVDIPMYDIDYIELETLDIKVLRRGVISVNKIGYIN